MKTTISLLFVLVFTFKVFSQSPIITFDEYKLADIGTVSIPSIMELQAGEYKELSNKVSGDLLKKQGFEVTGNSIIFQQKGLNEFKKVNTYARVMVETNIGKPGDHGKLTTKIAATKKELQEVSEILKKQLADQSAQMGIKIVRWDGVSIDTVNGRSVMKVSYLRQLKENPAVYVEMYYFENNDRVHTLTISYRQQDAAIWEFSLKRTKDSFTITTIR